MKLPERLPRIAINHRYSYPFLYHYLLALFPLRSRNWVERYTGAIFDTLNGILAYWFCSWLVNTFEPFRELSALPLWVLALFVFSPALLRLGSGPRAYNGSPRVLGQTLYLLHLLAAYYSYVTGNIPMLGVSICAGAAVFVTAKFSNQVLLLFGLFFFIFITWMYLPLVLVSFLVSTVASRGRALWVVQGQINHSKVYFQRLQHAFIYPNVRAAADYFDKVKVVWTELWSKANLGRFLYWYYTESYVWHLFFTVFPHFPLALAAGFFNRDASGVRFLFAWTLAGATGFIVTKLPRFGLMFLGEGERYLEYALLPSIILSVMILLPTQQPWLFGWLAYSLLSALFFIVQYLFRTDDTYAQTEKLFAELNKLPTGPILPIGSFQWQALYRSKFPVVTYGTNIEEQYIPLDDYQLLFGNYPYPSGNLRKVINHFNVDYIITDGPRLAWYRDKILNEDQDYESMTDLVCQSDTLKMYKIRR